jgi:pilus assembly protein CpaC
VPVHLRSSRFPVKAGLIAAAVGILVGAPSPAVAQRVVNQPQQVISVASGASSLLVNPTSIQRISVGNEAVADATVVSPTEVIINGKGLGTTTLLMWDNSGQVRLYSIEVTADAPALQRFIRNLMPQEEDITVSASGNTVTLSGTVTDALSVGRALEIVGTSGATIINNLEAPPAVQVLLKVRFAEINRQALRQWASQLAGGNVQRFDFDRTTDWEAETSSDGQISFLLTEGGAFAEAFLQAAKQRGDFRSLAEPNLVTLPGKEAYFLAGGRFPFPTLQGGGANNAVTIVFEEFGVKLRYTANILRNGSIRLQIAPEVSSLDFANGLTIGGFEIPTILTRRAETEVELREGQYLAIAGLLDNSSIDNMTKIPLLGDIPILGQLFRSKEIRQRRTELLILITPQLVQASSTATPLPTGETNVWKWDGWLKSPAPGTPGVEPIQGGQRPAQPAGQPR